MGISTFDISVYSKIPSFFRQSLASAASFFPRICNEPVTRSCGMYVVLRPVFRRKHFTRFIEDLLEVSKFCSEFGGKAVRDGITKRKLLIESIPLCTICRRSMRQIRTEQNELRFEEHSFCVSQQYPIGFLKRLRIHALLLRQLVPDVVDSGQD